MKFIVITALVLALVAVEAVVGTAIYRRAKEVAYNGQINDYIRLAVRLANSIDMALEQGKTETPDLSATLSGSKITFDGVEREYTADASVANNVSIREVNIYRLKEICNNPSADEFIKSDETVYAVYSEKQEDGKMRLTFRSFTELIADVSYEGFGGIAVFSGSGRSEFVDQSNEGETLSSNGDEDPMAKLAEYRLSIEDVEKARTPLYTTGGEDRSGMGFTIMESFTDKLAVRSKPGAGTTVVMTRTLPRRKPKT